MKPETRLKRILLVELILSIASLFLPFVCMKIGPGGYAYYGPTVPDIYILGGYILGKDVTWWAINFAYKFQLICILLYVGLTLICFLKYINTKWVFRFQMIRLVLLVCFPLWMFFYEEHVQNNSDGADLTVYPHIGWIAYLGLVYLQIRIFKRLIQNKKKYGV